MGKELTEDEKSTLRISEGTETKIKELENLKQKVYEVMESYSEQRLIITTLESAATNIDECIKKVEQW